MNQPRRPEAKKVPQQHPYVKGQKARLLEEREANQNLHESFHRNAQIILLNGESSTQYRTEFFDQIFIDLLNDLFSVWIHTTPEEVKKREYLYQSALALGSVKSWLLKAEQKGSNVDTILGEHKDAVRQARQDDLNKEDFEPLSSQDDDFDEN